jgi:hypothetical protein
MPGADGVKANQISCQMETGDLLVALFSDGIAFDGAGTNGVQRFQFITGLEQRLPFLNGFFALNNVVQLIELVLIQRERDTQLTNAAILTVNGATARLNASYNSLFRDR